MTGRPSSPEHAGPFPPRSFFHESTQFATVVPNLRRHIQAHCLISVPGNPSPLVMDLLDFSVMTAVVVGVARCEFLP